MIYCFDIDGTICSNTNGDYENAEPYYGNIAKLNSLFEDGNTIYLYTARGATTGINWRSFTEQQLKNWNVKFHLLFMGKPTADIYIDDKAVNVKDFFNS